MVSEKLGIGLQLGAEALQRRVQAPGKALQRPDLEGLRGCGAERGGEGAQCPGRGLWWGPGGGGGWAGGRARSVGSELQGRHGALSGVRWPWVKSQIVPPVHIPIQPLK